MLEPEQLRQLELDIEVALLNYGYSKQITNIVNALRDFIRDNNSPIYPEYIQEVEDFINECCHGKCMWQIRTHYNMSI